MQKELIENPNADIFDEAISKIKIELFNDPYGIHGITHAKRVILILRQLADHELLSIPEKTILAYAGLYHDIGRTNNGIQAEHGVNSYEKIVELGLWDDIKLNTEELEIMKFIIQYHCLSDDFGYKGVQGYNIKDIERAKLLFDIFKDADGLDRIRFSGLDIKYLRRPYSKTVEEYAQKIYAECSISRIDLAILTREQSHEKLITHCEYLKSKGLYDINFKGDHIIGIDKKTPFDIYLTTNYPKNLYHGTNIIAAKEIIQCGYIKCYEDKDNIKYNKVFFSDNVLYVKNEIENLLCMALEKGIYQVYKEYIIFEINPDDYNIYNYIDKKERIILGDVDISNIKTYLVKKDRSIIEISKEEILQLNPLSGLLPEIIPGKPFDLEAYKAKIEEEELKDLLELSMKYINSLTQQIYH